MGRKRDDLKVNTAILCCVSQLVSVSQLLFLTESI